MKANPQKKQDPPKARKLKLKKETINDLKSVNQSAKKIKGGAAAGPGSRIYGCTDRNLKENFSPVDVRQVLAGLMEISIQNWNYKSEDPSVRHIGPMAQDFAAAFRVGQDDKHIHLLDIAGVAFAAIQALFQMSRERDEEVNELRAELSKMQERMAITNAA